jgi:hypothetical protein
MFKTFILVLALSLNAFSDNSFETGSLSEEYTKLDEATGKKWQDYLSKQKDEAWINEQARLGIVGIVFEKGLIGETVSRNVLPDPKSGWLVVDTVYVPNPLLLTGANLAANIFFNAVTPLVGGRYHKEKAFVNVRNVETYKEALAIPVFSFQKIPSDLERFKSMAVGEVITTFSMSTYYVRGAYGIFNLLDLILPSNFDVGPQAKYSISAALKLTVTKESDSVALVVVEKVRDSGIGVGMTFGLSLDNLINAPISVGLNRPTGYVPIQFNIKESTEKIENLIYKIDLSQPLGIEAYKAFLKNDFHAMDAIADKKNPAVTSELKKEGEISKLQSNIGIDLLLFRGGTKNVYTEGSFVSKLADGKQFEYSEVTNEKIKEKKTPWAGTWRSEKFAALVPKANDANTFVVDSIYHFAVESADGKDVSKMIEKARATMNGFPLNYKVNDNQDYGEISLDLRFRFSSDAIKEFLAASDEEIWAALAVSSNIPDPDEWLTSQGRQKHKRRMTEIYLQENPKVCVDTNGGPCNPDMVYTTTPVDIAKAKFKLIKKIQAQRDFVEKSKLLIGGLKADGDEKIFHRTFIELAGRNRVYIKGLMRSKFL